MIRHDKKTDRIEIRVSPDEKTQFAQACSTQGDTPSRAIRRFMTGYIRRDDREFLRSGLRRIVFGKVGAVAAGAGALTAAMLLVVGSSAPDEALAHDAPYRAQADSFAVMDWDKNGTLEVGEIGKNDWLLHLALDRDGKAGLSPAEFRHQNQIRIEYTDGRPARCLMAYLDSWTPQAAPAERRLDPVNAFPMPSEERNIHRRCTNAVMVLDAQDRVASRNY